MTTSRQGGEPSASVVICAYTQARWETLVAAAEASRAQQPAPLEVVIVADHAPELLERVRRELPWTVAIANDSQRGLSGARNAGIAAARGEVVVFLDDDAIPEPAWLSHLLAPYADPTVLGVGGAALPAFPAGRPAFLAPEFDWVVGCTYRGLPERLAPVRNFIGANMSLRREAFAVAGGFRAGIGRVGTLPVGCEETELCIRLRRLRPDAELLYEPRARVRHMVTLERARTRYFVTRCWSEGVSKALVAHQAGARQGLASERTHALRTLPRGVARELGTLLSLRDAAGALRAAGIAVGLTVTAAGYARGTLRRRPTPPSSAPSADRASAVNDLPEGARGAPPSLADLTVVVPVRDAEGLVDDCLAPIAAGSPAEVIVVDGASTDATVERARAHGARVLSDEGRGLPVARMLGAREARTAYVALVDVDVTMPPDALSALLEEVHAGGYGALQAGLLSTGGPGYWGRALAHHHRTGRSRGWFGVVATVFRRDVLLEHGFDDAFLSGEDIDLRWRLRRAGVRIGVSERTFVEHRFGDGFVFARGQWMADGHGLGRMILGHGLSAKLLLGLPLAGGIRGILLSLWRREPQWIPYYLCFTAFNYVAMGRELRSRLRSRPR